MIKQRLTIALSVVIASLVLFSSMRMVQVFGAALTQRAHDDGTSIVKVAPDFHHHSDKTGVQLVKDAGDNQQFYSDYRTLRTSRSAKKDIPYRYRVAGWLQDSWLQLTTLFS
jgi:hypothetical protein